MLHRRKHSLGSSLEAWAGPVGRDRLYGLCQQQLCMQFSHPISQPRPSSAGAEQASTALCCCSRTAVRLRLHELHHARGRRQALMRKVHRRPSHCQRAVHTTGQLRRLLPIRWQAVPVLPGGLRAGQRHLRAKPPKLCWCLHNQQPNQVPRLSDGWVAAPAASGSAQPERQPTAPGLLHVLANGPTLGPLLCSHTTGHVPLGLHRLRPLLLTVVHPVPPPLPGYGPRLGFDHPAPYTIAVKGGCVPCSDPNCFKCSNKATECDPDGCNAGYALEDGKCLVNKVRMGCPGCSCLARLAVLAHSLCILMTAVVPHLWSYVVGEARPLCAAADVRCWTRPAGAHPPTHPRACLPLPCRPAVPRPLSGLLPGRHSTTKVLCRLRGWVLQCPPRAPLPGLNMRAVQGPQLLDLRGQAGSVPSLQGRLRQRRRQVRQGECSPFWQHPMRALATKQQHGSVAAPGPSSGSALYSIALSRYQPTQPALTVYLMPPTHWPLAVQGGALLGVPP